MQMHEWQPFKIISQDGKDVVCILWLEKLFVATIKRFKCSDHGFAESS